MGCMDGLIVSRITEGFTKRSRDPDKSPLNSHDFFDSSDG